jgi:hypothetical protein
VNPNFVEVEGEGLVHIGEGLVGAGARQTRPAS